MTSKIFHCIVTLSLITCHLTLFSCTGNSPNLSEKKLQALMNDVTLKPAETPTFTLPDSNYVPQAGVKYSEIRAIDPAAPPIVIDISGNLNNKKVFKLSDFASSVTYIRLPPPPDTKFSSITDIATDDERIFISAREGLFCYSADGTYRYTMIKNQFDELSNMPVMGSRGQIDLLNGILVNILFHLPAGAPGYTTDVKLNFFDVKELDTQMFVYNPSNELNYFGATPKYQRQLKPEPGHHFLLMNDQSVFHSGLTLTSIGGDTLCKFTNFDQPAVDRIMQGRGAGSRPGASIYRINGNVMLSIGLNDTIFRVIPPNRLAPVYIMNWGNYKPNLVEFVTSGAMAGKFILRSWLETQQFIFIHYTEGNNAPRYLDLGNVKFYYAIYDKTTKTLTHHLTSTTPAIRQRSGTITRTVSVPLLIENDIDPVGMPFWPQALNHRGEMYMTFSKEQIKDYINTGRYRNDKLQAIYDSMPDDAICIMIVK